MSDNSVVLRYGDGEYTYPVIDSTVGDKGFDIGKLRAQTGLVTLDSGYGNTAAYKSAITYLDGEQGILRYRGYPIEQLAERATFLEVAYLLINGELPTVDELAAFKSEITQHTLLHEDVKRFYDGFPRDAHPMAMLSSVVSALSTFYQDSHNPFDEKQRNLSTIRLLAKLPTIAAYAYKKSIGHPFVYPRNDLGYVENFLRMTFSVPAEEYELDPVVVSALDKLLILHADHEQNCSTSTVRLVGSSQANLFASISAGISALWGPLHGGANQSRAGDAGGHPGRRRRRRHLHPQGEEQGGRRPADGLRPPRLQELRPAREDHQGGGARRPLGARQVRRAARHRAASWRSTRSPTTTSSSASSTRTSTSTPASSTGRWASRPSMFTVLFALGRLPGLDRPVARDDQGAGLPHRPPAPDLHGRRRARLRPGRGPLTCERRPRSMRSAPRRIPPRVRHGALPFPGADPPTGPDRAFFGCARADAGAQYAGRAAQSSPGTSPRPRDRAVPQDGPYLIPAHRAPPGAR